jgi:hypothetical protein
LSDLPKKYDPPLLPEEIAALEEWERDTGWTRQKSIDYAFARPEWKESMPQAIPVVKGLNMNDWSGRAICVCVMCGYVTSSTNIHRKCPDLPADHEDTDFTFCYYHTPDERRRLNDEDEPTIHFIIRNGEKISTSHRGIKMVAVSRRKLD